MNITAHPPITPPMRASFVTLLSEPELEFEVDADVDVDIGDEEVLSVVVVECVVDKLSDCDAVCPNWAVCIVFPPSPLAPFPAPNPGPPPWFMVHSLD